MKTKLMIVFAILMSFVSISAISAEQPLSEYERYLQYYESQLMRLKDGGTYQGTIYEAVYPDQERCDQGVEFVAPIVNGQAEGSVGVRPGWYQGYAEWQDSVRRDNLFMSRPIEPTSLGTGVQIMPFVMAVNNDGFVRLQFSGQTMSDREEIWFGDERAWWNGSEWEVRVRQPWNLIGQDVQVVWKDHGGWNVEVNEDFFRGQPISFDSAELDKDLKDPTFLLVPSMNEIDLYSGANLFSFDGWGYDQNLGRTIIMTVDSDQPIYSGVVKFYAYDEGFRTWVTYLSLPIDNIREGVKGQFQLPIGDNWIRSNTYLVVYYLDPTGKWRAQWLSTDDGGGHG